jgi:hypothetical protein
MKEHVDAAELQRTTGSSAEAVGRLSFGEALTRYRKQLASSHIPQTPQAYREAGLGLVFSSSDDVEGLNFASQLCRAWREGGCV